jgi:hypothetical protein
VFRPVADQVSLASPFLRTVIEPVALWITTRIWKWSQTVGCQALLKVASTAPVMPPLRSTILPGRSKQTEHWVVAPSCSRIAATADVAELVGPAGTEPGGLTRSTRR